jgi:hypothetical protein
VINRGETGQRPELTGRVMDGAALTHLMFSQQLRN